MFIYFGVVWGIAALLGAVTFFALTVLFKKYQEDGQEKQTTDDAQENQEKNDGDESSEV